VIEMIKFVPLDSKPKEYLFTRSEILKIARDVLKGYYFKELSLEDTNKLSFITDDFTFRDFLWIFCEFSNQIDDVIDMSIDGLGKDESKKYQGFWVIVHFNWPKLFPLSKKKGIRKIGRLKGWVMK
jgi:hypothetical protein